MQAAHAEPTWDDDRDLPALMTRLEEMATFLGLRDVEVKDNGDLAPLLATTTS